MGHSLSADTTGGGAHPKCIQQLRAGGGAATSHVDVHTHTISFYVLEACFSYAVLYYL